MHIYPLQRIKKLIRRLLSTELQPMIVLIVDGFVYYFVTVYGNKTIRFN